MASLHDTGSSPGPGEAPDPDWAALERSPEFQALNARRRRFVVPALASTTVLYGLFIVLTAWGRDFMGSSIHRGFTVAYAFALVLIVMVWVIAWRYARVSNRTLAPMIDRVIESTKDTRPARAENPTPGTGGVES